MDNGTEKLGRGQRMRSKTKRAQESETQVTTRKAPKKAPKNAAATGRHAKKKLTASSDNDDDEDPDDLLTINEYGAKTRTDKQGSTDAHPDKDLGDERLSSPQNAALAMVPREDDRDHLLRKLLKENEARSKRDEALAAKFDMDNPVDNSCKEIVNYFLHSDVDESEPMEKLDSSAGDAGKLAPQKAVPSEEDGKVNAGEVDKVAGNMAPQKPAPSEENPLFMHLSKRFIDMVGQTSEGSDTAQLLGGQSPSRKAMGFSLHL